MPDFGGNLAAYKDGSTITSKNAVLQEVHIFGPHLLNDFRFGFAALFPTGSHLGHRDCARHGKQSGNTGLVPILGRRHRFSPGGFTAGPVAHIPTGMGTTRQEPVPDPERLRAGLISRQQPADFDVAANGNLYIACRGITVYTPEGKFIRMLDFPETPANCAFGDSDLKTLYVAARTSV